MERSETASLSNSVIETIPSARSRYVGALEIHRTAG
ncbi:MAG: hypothetical protein RLZ79_761 [Pseudomonadota bacterium]